MIHDLLKVGLLRYKNFFSNFFYNIIQQIDWELTPLPKH
jgi:hypothetical protein